MKALSYRNKILNIFLALILILVSVAPYFTRPAYAAYSVELTEGFIRLDRLKASTATGGTVCVKPSTTHTTAADGVEVVFPTGFTLSETTGDWTAAGSTLGGATAFPSIATATITANDTTKTVTWTVVDQTLSAGTMYCFSWSNTASLTNTTAGNDKAGTIQVNDTTAGSNEGTAYALSIVAEDQVTVDADVPPLFTFTVPDTALDHGTLSTSTVDPDTQSSGMAIYTNAENGWIAWMKADSTNGYGLYSASTADTIGDAVSDTDVLETAVAGTEDWIISVSKSNNGTIVTEFDGDEATTGGMLPSDGTFEQIASYTSVSNTDTISLTSIAAISNLNKAATDYRETLTIVAAGNF
jgi:hypothetical protein